MSTYSNINVASLKEMINTAITELSKKKTILDDIKEKISNKEVLDSNIRGSIKNALTQVIASEQIIGSMVVIKKQLDNMLTILNYIEKIQEAEEKMAVLNEKLYYEQKYTEKITLPSGIVKNAVKTKKLINEDVAEEIHTLEEVIESIEQTVGSLLS